MGGYECRGLVLADDDVVEGGDIEWLQDGIAKRKLPPISIAGTIWPGEGQDPRLPVPLNRSLVTFLRPYQRR
jgi:hypothetical protein